jgi:Flp pilus assembly protein TadG
VVLLPLFILLCLIAWQLFLSGMAVIDTNAAVRDAVRVAATTGDTDKAEKQGKNSFGQSGSYKLKRLDVKIEDGEAIA